jgi:hypothetical protein
LLGVGGEQIQRIADSAHRGVDRRSEIVDHQWRAFVVAELAFVGGEQQFVGHAAVDHGALADDAAGKAQHSQRARHRFDGLPIEWAEDVEGRSTPRNEVVSLVAGPADEIRNHG